MPEKLTVKEFRQKKFDCLDGKNAEGIVVPWDYEKCFMQYNATDQNAENKEELFNCWKLKAKLTLNQTFCDALYPLERELGYWKVLCWVNMGR